jgi:hypothetical protein
MLSFIWFRLGYLTLCFDYFSVVYIFISLVG